MNETLIPWDFLGLLFGAFCVAMIAAFVVHGLKLRRRNRLQSPRKDYVYKNR